MVSSTAYSPSHGSASLTDDRVGRSQSHTRFAIIPTTDTNDGSGNLADGHLRFAASTIRVGDTTIRRTASKTMPKENIPHARSTVQGSDITQEACCKFWGILVLLCY